jgi:uncharacterized membrane protein
MNDRLKALAESLRAGFWFIPALMCLAAAGLVVGLVQLDLLIRSEWIERLGWFFVDSADGARAALATIASSTITVAGTVFSLTMVTLTLASNQFGPRLIRNFMRDLATQAVLGSFVATYLYCILLLRLVRSVEEVEFVPNLAVLVALLLAILNVGVLIYFFHHVSTAIQVPRLIAWISDELQETIRRLFPLQRSAAPERSSHWREVTALRAEAERDGAPVAATRSGYVILIDQEALLARAVAESRVISLEVRLGDFVVQGATLAHVLPAPADGLAEAINGAFVFGHQRLQLEDFEVYMLQLVEIAARALSPAFNDPFTAMACVDRLAEAILLLDDRELPPPFCRDEAGRLRLLLEGYTFAAAMDAAFSMVRQYARGHTAVLVRLLDAFTAIATQTERAERRSLLRRHANLVLRAAEESLPEQIDREEVARRHRALVDLLES